AQALVPRRLRLDDVEGGEREHRDGRDEEGEPSQATPSSCSSTLATNASSSSSVPSFTYAKSARLTFSSSGKRRAARPSGGTFDRPARSFAGAVTTTTRSNAVSLAASKSSGISLTATVGGSGRRLRSSSHAAYSSATRGWSKASRNSSCSGSAKTI